MHEFEIQRKIQAGCHIMSAARHSHFLKCTTTMRASDSLEKERSWEELSWMHNEHGGLFRQQKVQCAVRRWCTRPAISRWIRLLSASASAQTHTHTHAHLRTITEPLPTEPLATAAAFYFSSAFAWTVKVKASWKSSRLINRWPNRVIT